MKFPVVLCSILLGIAASSTPDLNPAAATAVLYLQGKFHHVQGIDVEGKILWISSVNSAARKGYLSRVDLSTGRLEAQVEIQSGERIHPGGISLQGNAVWVPLAEYRRNGNSTIQKRDKRTLSLLAEFPVDDHIGCLAAGPGWIAGGNWDSLQIYFWNPQGRVYGELIICGTTPGDSRIYYDYEMRNLVILFVHVIATLARLLGLLRQNRGRPVFWSFGAHPAFRARLSLRQI